MTFQTRKLSVALGAVLLCAVLLLPTTVLAHERRPIGDGKYAVVVGWDVEPAFEGQKNAASIRVSRAGTNPAQPVEGLDKTLKVEIRQGSQTREFPLRTVFGQPGYYVADIIPTRTGNYQFHFVGTVEGVTIDEQFDSADGKFNGVESASALEFPTARVDASATASSASNAQALALGGIGIGVVALLAALFAVTRRGVMPPKRRAQASA